MSGAGDPYGQPAHDAGALIPPDPLTYNEFLEMFNELLDRHHAQSIQYANRVLTVGYAGYFGLWAMAKEHIGANAARWSVLLVAISLTVFIVFEVAKMVATAQAQKARVAAKSGKHRDFKDLVATMRAAERDAAAAGRRIDQYWPKVLLACGGTAAIGGIILMVALVLGLFRGPA